MSDWKNVQYKDGKMRTSESGGGSGGTEIEGNPSGTPTAELTTIRIGESIFSLPTGGGGTIEDLLDFEPVYYSIDAQVLSYTETVVEATQFFIFGSAGDSGGTFTTDGTILFSQAIDGRNGFVYIVDCDAGDSISISVANQSGSAYYGSELVVLKSKNKVIKTASKLYSVSSRDAWTGLYSDIGFNTNDYIIIGTACGRDRNMYFSVDEIIDRTFTYKGAFFISYIHNKNYHLEMQARGYTAGGATIFYLQVTTDSAS